MNFIKENPGASLVIAAIVVLVGVVIIGPVISFLKWVAMVVGVIVISKWVLSALSKKWDDDTGV